MSIQKPENIVVRKNKTLFALVLILFLLLIPPLFFPEFWVCISTEILILGLAGMGVNILMGYGGMLPFGHAVFYAIGAYTTAILLKKTSVNPIIVLISAPLIASVFGFIFGLVLARLHGFYFAMVSTSFTMLVWTILRKWYGLTGGDDGLPGVPIPEILRGSVRSYIFVLIVVIISLLAIWKILYSPFGWTLRAIRENIDRCLFIKINVYKHRLVAIIISSFFTGLAGSLFVIYGHSAFPEYSYWLKSTEFAIVAILGGMYTFIGPILGSATFIILQTLITSHTLYWPFFLGLIICGIVLWLPDGIAGIQIENLLKSYKWRENSK